MEALRCVGDKGLFRLRDSLLSIPAASEICYLRPPYFLHKHATNLGVSLGIPLPERRPILPFSSMSSTDIQAETHDDETETYDIINQIQTVHVRFQLQRECSFGQHFYIVGDDPLLGQWDPTEAVPFNWSDGHVWTTELDIPIGKCIKFKIILKDGSENIIWQPGPDRILQTWETQNTLTVCEDWDSAELQKIIEEKSILNQIEEEITGSHKEVTIDKDNTVPGRGFVSNPKECPADISDEAMNMLKVGANGSMMNLNESKVSTDETLSTNRLPLLVPGLNPLPKTQPEEKPLKEVKRNILSDASSLETDIFELNMPELKFEEVLVNGYQEQHQPLQIVKLKFEEVLVNDYQEQHQPLQIVKPQFFEDEDEHNPKSFDLVLVNDIHWGLRTLQKLLAKFRFW